MESNEEKTSNKRAKKFKKKKEEVVHNSELNEEFYNTHKMITELNMDGTEINNDLSGVGDSSTSVDPISNSNSQKRQTMIFSATLTLPNILKPKYHSKQKVNPPSPLGSYLNSFLTFQDKLMNAIHFQKKIEVIDLTTKVVVAETLKEEKIECLLEDKVMN